MADSLIDYAPEFPSTGPISVTSLNHPIVSAHAQQFQNFRLLAGSQILGLWDATIGLHPIIDQEAAHLWATSVGPMIKAAQSEAVSMTQAYMEHVLSNALERKIEATFNKGDLLRDLRNGATNDQVYYRPVKTARTVMSVGGSRQQANVEAKKRLSQLVRTDLQLAKTKTAQKVMNDPSVGDDVKWYKRVLKGTTNCGLCMYASTRTYYKADLMPIHPGCDCEPMGMTSDPRRITHDPELLQQLKDIGAVDDPGQVVIYKHGEYGPTLARSVDEHLTSALPRDRITLTSEMVENRADDDAPRLGGYTADAEDRHGVKMLRPDWAEVVGGVEQVIEVAEGPTVIGSARMVEESLTPGRGLAYVTKDGRLFYAEFDEFDYEGQRDEAERRLRRMMDDERRAMPRTLTGEFWNPAEVSMSVTMDRTRQSNQGTFRVNADAGRGRVVHYNAEVLSETVWHETGHIVAGAFNKFGEQTSRVPDRHWYGDFANPGEVWLDAMQKDHDHLRQLIAEDDQFESLGMHTIRASATAQVLKWGATGPDSPGVSPYGSTSLAEDFAESWRLAIRDRIAIVKPADSPEKHPDEGWEALTFQEMFPNRYAYFQGMAERADMKLPF